MMEDYRKAVKATHALYEKLREWFEYDDLVWTKPDYHVCFRIHFPRSWDGHEEYNGVSISLADPDEGASLVLMKHEDHVFVPEMGYHDEVYFEWVNEVVQEIKRLYSGEATRPIWRNDFDQSDIDVMTEEELALQKRICFLDNV